MGAPPSLRRRRCGPALRPCGGARGIGQRPETGRGAMTGFVRRAGLRFAFCSLLLYNLQLALSWIPGAGWLVMRYQERWAAVVPWVGRHVLRLGGEIAAVPNGSGDRTFDHVQVFCMAV